MDARQQRPVYPRGTLSDLVGLACRFEQRLSTRTVPNSYRLLHNVMVRGSRLKEYLWGTSRSLAYRRMRSECFSEPLEKFTQL
jgi:hypothetical protein